MRPLLAEQGLVVLLDSFPKGVYYTLFPMPEIKGEFPPISPVSDIAAETELTRLLVNDETRSGSAQP